MRRAQRCLTAALEEGGGPELQRLRRKQELRMGTSPGRELVASGLREAGLGRKRKMAARLTVTGEEIVGWEAASAADQGRSSRGLALGGSVDWCGGREREAAQELGRRRQGRKGAGFGVGIDRRKEEDGDGEGRWGGGRVQGHREGLRMVAGGCGGREGRRWVTGEEEGRRRKEAAASWVGVRQWELRRGRGLREVRARARVGGEEEGRGAWVAAKARVEKKKGREREGKGWLRSKERVRVNDDGRLR